MAALLATACFAQTATPDALKPPAEVDQAIRQRINDFYGLMLKHEFRKAEALVAEDTKDYYYNLNKPDFTRFELLDVQFSDNFKKATATTLCAQTIMQPGFPRGEWNLKVPSLWKFEDGNWYWYVNQKQQMTPVGIVRDITPEDRNSKPAPVTGGIIPKDILSSPTFTFKKITVDKDSVILEGDKPEKITIQNGLPGGIRLVLPKQLGLDLQLEPTMLGQGERAVLTMRAIKGSASGVLYVNVVPTGEKLAIHVEVK